MGLASKLAAFAARLTSDSKVPQTALAANVAGNGPAFSAYSAGGQSLTGNTTTKIQFGSEDFDTASCYDTASYRFTPTVAGYYQVNGVLAVGANTNIQTAIYKNGSVWIWGQFGIATNWSNCSGLVYLNGSTDYIELYGYVVTTQTTQAASTYKFQASMVRAA